MLNLATAHNVPEFWEFSYKIHLNLDGREYPINIEVIVHKNGKPFWSEWLENTATKNTKNVQKTNTSI